MNGWAGFVYGTVVYGFMLYGAYKAGRDLQSWLARWQARKSHYNKLFQKEG